MKNFDIDFYEDEKAILSGNIRLAYIMINDFREDFEVDTSYWAERDYRERWRTRLSDACKGVPVGLIQSISAPIEEMNFIMMWKFYPFAEKVLIQEQLLDLRNNKKSLNNVELDIDQYEQFTDDGDEVSTWEIDREEILKYLL